jgi:hypothetical protein
VLAVAVMSNHLHVVVQQGDRTLSAFMQPLLRRLALRVQAVHGLEGPVFWRPYASQPCMDPAHIRNAIVYTHLNPVRAGLCADPADYVWTSHDLYALRTKPPGPLVPIASVLDPANALPLFATGPERSIDELTEDYREFVVWRQATDRLPKDARGDQSESLPGWVVTAWGASLSPLLHSPARHGDAGGYRDGGARAHVPDLAAVAKAALAREAPGVLVDSIRGRRGGPRVVLLRHTVIRSLHAAGYRNVEIARFIGLSESGVSYVLCKRGPRP